MLTVSYDDYEKYLSRPRMERYLCACDGDGEKTIKLYQQSYLLSGYFYNLISLFEIILRNMINEFLKVRLGENWLLNSISSDGVFDSSYTIRSKKLIEEAINHIKLKPGISDEVTNDAIVAQLSFGFWKSLFYKNQHLALGDDSVNIWVGIVEDKRIPNPVSRKKMRLKVIGRRIGYIHEERNRLAHHEQLALNSQNVINKQKQELLISQIIDLTESLGCNSSIYSHIVKLIQNQQKTLMHICPCGQPSG